MKAEGVRDAASPGVSMGICRSTRSGPVDIGLQMHYTGDMKTAVIPQVRVEPELRAQLDNILDKNETLSDFVEEAVRRAVEHRRVLVAFHARGEAAWQAY